MPITENEDTEKTMSSDAGIAVVRRNTEEVQGRGNFEVFEELFAADFVDHTPQPGGFTPDRPMVRRIPTPVPMLRSSRANIRTGLSKAASGTICLRKRRRPLPRLSSKSTVIERC